ncbi:MAG: hypothetical protein E6590_16900 [Clostridiales bacterium]|uniref:Uncharacterized protein n=1 Tax=Zhenhengia yiwuensis TaxID=2763666 RepID=A0A926IET7_9FIRM|nr:hypothetical protein [Zhenhengia yiwuensis]MBC8581137.1 hypothetical protein [Zhenhengia yiwuensis]MDU6361611.1 hypothetical protein [Clostridiales bacterium]
MNYIDISHQVEDALRQEKKRRKKDKTFTEEKQIEFVKRELRKNVTNLTGLKRLKALDMETELFSPTNLVAILLLVLSLLISPIIDSFKILEDLNVEMIKGLIYPSLSLDGIILFIVCILVVLMIVLLPIICIFLIIYIISRYFGRNNKLRCILNIGINELIEEYEKKLKNKSNKQV